MRAKKLRTQIKENILRILYFMFLKYNLIKFTKFKKRERKKKMIDKEKYSKDNKIVF